MTASYRKLIGRRPDDRGQAMLMVVLAMGIFLLGAVAFGVDIANLWFHRQAAQTAADAACTAGAMDLLYDAEGQPAPASSSGSWTWIGQNNLNCSGHFSTGSSMYAPCWYGAQNGYNGTGLVTGSASNQVSLSSPTSVSGVSTCSSSSSGTACLPGWVTYPLLQVNVSDRVKVFFMGMINGKQTMDVGAQAICGVLQVQSPVPLIVLDPRNETSVTNVGNFTIDIYGGPQRSIQVNSTSTSAVSISGASGSINLSQGGPNQTGSSLGVTGAEPGSSVSRNLSLGTTGQYIAPDGPISDPFATVCAPGQTSDCQTTMDGTAGPGVPAAAPAVGTVPPGVDGCPASGVTSCDHYQAGSYSTGIDVKNRIAVFDPGLYYVSGGLTLDTGSQVCPGTGVAPYAGDGSFGATFYLADNYSISVNSNSGSGTTTPCTNSSGSALTAADIKCTATSTLPGNLPGTTALYGNILLAPCSGYYGDPLGTSDPTGEQRGMLFFQNRSQSLSSKNQPQWGGGGAFTLGGAMYFHYCDSSSGVAGDGVSCNTTNGYTDQLSLQGGSCSGTYILGNIIIDQLALGGNPCINMDLSPTVAYPVLKASLLQ